jgi:type III pantothenate kinase
MLLAIDVGNTNTVFGITHGNGVWDAIWRVGTCRSTLGNDWAAVIATLARRDGIDFRVATDVCICSVVPSATTALVEYAREWLRIEPEIVTADATLNISLGMDNPREVGADRIANAVAAWELCRTACIVVDMGTATKVEAITDDGVFAGGSIAIGIGASMEALVSRSARLFEVELREPETAIGRNTIEAVQAGIVRGHRHLVGGLIQDIRLQIGLDAPVLVTGGFAAKFREEIGTLAQHEPNLTLDGVSLIHSLNAG